MLAHARLMTSDLLTALFFLASAWALWRLLRRVTLPRLILSALAVSGLLLSKMSGVLIVPMGVVLLTLRLWRGGPWEVRLLGRERDVASRSGQLGIAGATVVAHVLVAWTLLWAFYGFHYSTFQAHRTQADQFEAGVSNLLGQDNLLGATVQFAQDHRLLPEAYLYGFSFAVDQSQRRPAFLAGERSEEGWRWFFPYAFAVKTSEALLLLLAVAALAAWGAGVSLPEAIYRTAPLWVLLGVYGWFAVRTNLNIGHRHLLPLYPALFLLAGAAGRWLVAPERRRSLAAGAAVLLVMATGLVAWPDYLAYFNRVSGGPSKGYRHLVDSSLDWGQDLPALRRWLTHEGLDRRGEKPVYLSYFGTSSPDHHGIRAWRLPGFFDAGRRRALVPLRGGVYCISASMLQLYASPGSAPWDADAEAMYQALLSRLPVDPGSATRPLPYTSSAMEQFDLLRLAKLVDYLRGRPPDDNIAGSLLVYRLTEEEVQNALYRKIA
jgi:hypothetical protein